MEYYYVDQNGQQKGPVEENLLISLGVTPNTLVWKTGMQEWQKAGEVNELKNLFLESLSQTPPPMRTNQKPDNYLVWCILTTLLCCMPIGIYAIICSSHVDSYYNQGKYNKAKEESEKAKKWAIISAICGVVGGFIYCMIMLLAAI